MRAPPGCPAALFFFRMKLEWRRLRRGETDWELVLGVLWTPLFLLTILVVLHLPGALIPVCRFHRITGIPCPTCGAYRAMHLLLNGDPAAALRMQPLVCAGALGLVVFSLYSWLVVLGRKTRLRPAGLSRRTRRLVGLGVLAAFLLNWMWLLIDGR